MKSLFGTRRPVTRSQTQVKPKLVAQGNHGCLFRPALKCEKGKINPMFTDDDTVSKVGKIFKETDSWESEVRANSLIMRIPDYKKYFITPLQSCIVDKSQKELYDTCVFDIVKPVNVPQIVMQDAGQSVYDYIYIKNTLKLNWENG